MTPDVERIIKREIHFMFGRTIASSRDCIELSEEVFKLTKCRLNSNTLRRFYGLIKSDYSVSSSTLLILCNYCGFPTVEAATNAIDDHGDSNVADKSVVDYLISLFKETPVRRGRNELFNAVVKQTILFLNQHPRLVDRFQCMVAKYKNGQEYYFEYGVHLDRLNAYYGNGLRYYLSEKPEPGAQILGHSLLVFRYWLTEDNAGVERHFQELNRFGLYPALSYHIPGRYFASLIYYDNLRKVSPVTTLTIIQKYYAAIGAENTLLQHHFEIAVAEALVLTGSFEEGLHYLEMTLKNAQATALEESQVQHVYLLKAIALIQEGNLKDAQLMYRLVRPSLFNYLSKKMLTILYGYLTRIFDTNGDEVGSQPEMLIQETGFTKLQKTISYYQCIKY